MEPATRNYIYICDVVVNNICLGLFGHHKHWIVFYFYRSKMFHKANKMHTIRCRFFIYSSVGFCLDIFGISVEDRKIVGYSVEWKVRGVSQRKRWLEKQRM